MDKINPFRHKPQTILRPLLSALFPTTLQPLLISAPMLGISTGRLAAAVSSAGGLGFLAGGYDFTPGSPQLSSLSAELTAARAALDLADRPLTPVPVGVGFILCHPSASRFEETALPLLIEHSPQAVWLFAPGPDPEGSGAELQGGIVGALKHAGFTVFVQVGSVSAARRAVVDGADVVVAQGIDAGGHQFARGAGVVSLVPEVRSMLDEEFAGREVGLVAAGGIVDGRALGAEGAVMGTRFVLCQESQAPEYRRKAIIGAVDGGVSTVKSTFHDDILGTKVWPEFYDGRAIVGQSYQDHASGVSFEDNLQRFNAAKEAGDDSRMVTWAGTGVGLVKKDIPAADIVREVREEAIKRIQHLQSFVPHEKQKGDSILPLLRKRSKDHVA
ncbi:2-nitropropane dioxygenase [Coniochaeta ligniaria NRRL 30616]|uniref:2-nitropropane dioxygenase n=1 Tax=Coniochaeta ligniaria NRRL 30616 TaxID=1408157 RepID=A0A1J7INJ7_9PEZI|nr:2-nitropropane dioxygenase [Coniochaeta ligniaria NRRL 30616]